MSPRLWHHRISDILEAINKIHRYVTDMDFTDFERDDKTVDAVIRNFIVIGEAARHIPEPITDQFCLQPKVRVPHPGVPRGCLTSPRFRTGFEVPPAKRQRRAQTTAKARHGRH
jgi:hypothetical protein